ncbi:MAG TPA: glycosyltransferase family 4 protein [Pseudolabrys sp.]|nr:glycosyltransferase family 4 protein [Pseudolabrys sp.]
MNELWQPRREASGTVATPLHPRTVVFLGTAHDGGGSSVLASTLASAMRAEGHHVEEWYLFGSYADVPPGARVFLNRRRSRSPITLAVLFARAVKALRALKPDAVFGLQPLSNLLAAVAGALAGVRHRVGTHHLPYDQFNPVLMKFDGVAGRVGLYSDLVACGHSVADTYRHNGEAYMQRLKVIPNGHRKPVPADRAAARAAFGLPPKGAVLGQLGRLYHQKNQRFSIGLLRDLPGTSLLIVGSGPDEDLVRSEIASRGYEDRVRLQLHLDHARIGEFYSAIDAVLFPSSFEGLSLAAIEAIHAGVPLICSDIPSFREMFRDSPLLAGQLIVPLGDREAWLERIRSIAGDETLRAQIVSELRRLSPRYAFETMSAKYLALLD